MKLVYPNESRYLHKTPYLRKNTPPFSAVVCYHSLFLRMLTPESAKPFPIPFYK